MTTDDASTISSIVAQDHDDAVAMCLELSNLDDRSGVELAVASALADGYVADGVEVRLQHLSETSANVVARIPGTAPDSAPSLMLNSHLDTEGWLPEGGADLRHRLRGAWRDGDLLIGKGLVNAKVHLVAQRFAARALLHSGLELGGDLVLTGTAQETGVARPASGPDGSVAPHEQEGVGARWLVDRGVLADYVIVGEPTGFAVCRAQAGYIRLRVDVEGEVPYTPFVVRTPGARPVTTNPFEAAGPVITAIAEWAADYERRAAVDVDGGRVEPKAQVQAVRAGTAAFTEERDVCQIFVDVRTAPGADALAVQRDLTRRVREAGPVVRVECFDHRRGYVARGAGELVEAVEAAHRTVFGAAPSNPVPAQTSMWQDTNAFNEVGMRAISYGIRPVPETFTRERIRGMRVDDLRALTTVYALSALSMCVRTR